MWSFEFASQSAVDEVNALPPDLQAKLRRIAGMIESGGLAAMREPYVRPLQDKLWEIRLIGRAGIARSLYITMAGRRVVILRTFVKKSRKTPRREIELAQMRAREVR